MTSSPPMKYTHILFDLDNTILDFNQASKLSFEAIMKTYKLDHIPDLYNIYKVVNKQVWRELEMGTITQTELRSKRWNLFFDEIGVRKDGNAANDLYLANLVVHAKLIPGAIDILALCKGGGINTTVVTNGLKEVQRDKIKKFELDPYFDHIVISDEIGVAKPHAPFFDYVFDQIGHPAKENVLIVGDTLTSDVKGGLDYGIDACWYNYEGTDKIPNLQPTYTILDISELKGIILPL